MPCSHRTPAAGLLISGVLAGALAATTSHASPPGSVEGARELFIQAEADEDADHWSDALEKIRIVAQYKPTAGVRYHIALCEERLGQLVRALRDYGAAEDQARLENAKDVLRIVGKQLAALDARVPRLAMHVVPPLPEALVKLDGEPVADVLSDAPRLVDPGVHQVESTAPGRLAWTTVVSLREYESKILEVSLGEPSVRMPNPATVTPSAPPAVADSTPTSPPGNHGAAIVMSGVFIALGGGGAAAYLVAGSEHERAVSTCASFAGAQVDPCASLRTKVRAWDWAAAGAWGGALVTGVITLVLWTRGGAPAPKAGANLSIGPTGLGVRGWF